MSKIPWREKISYGLAGLGFNFYWANINLFLTFFNTRERIAPPPTQKTNLGQDIGDLSRNGPWLAPSTVSR